MKVAIHTLGCKVNSYESQAISEQFEAGGWEQVDFSAPADVYIINTCSVTAVAAQKSRQMIHRARKLSSAATIIACGCYAQEAKELLLENGADYVIGNNEKNRIFEIAGKGYEEKVLVDNLTGCGIFEEQKITNQGKNVRAFVKIQDGCNRFCSYCIIPFLRGRSRSRKFSEIISETKVLSKNGYREVVLTGIDISMFGLDFENGKRADENLADLIEEIAEIEGISRIRLGSLEESLITESFVKRISKVRELCPHFHLSLQSGSNEILKKMNRKYTAEQYFERVCLLRQHFENPAITTDVIVGFPGESEELFEESHQFVKKVGFAEMHVFPYSRRKGTAADKMPGQLSKSQKSDRVSVMMKTAEELQRNYLESWRGKKVSILVEEAVILNTDKENKVWQTGLTPEYIKTGIPCEETMINSIVETTFKPEISLAFL